MSFHGQGVGAGAGGGPSARSHLNRGTVFSVRDKYPEDVIQVFQEVSALSLRGHKEEVWKGLCLGQDSLESCEVDQEAFTKFILNEGERYNHASAMRVIQEKKHSIPPMMKKYHETAFRDAQKQHTAEFSDHFWSYMDVNKDGLLKSGELDEACRKILAVPAEQLKLRVTSKADVFSAALPPLAPQLDEEAATAALKFSCSACSKGLETDRNYHFGFTRFREKGARC